MAEAVIAGGLYWAEAYGRRLLMIGGYWAEALGGGQWAEAYGRMLIGGGIYSTIPYLLKQGILFLRLPLCFALRHASLEGTIGIGIGSCKQPAPAPEALHGGSGDCWRLILGGGLWAEANGRRLMDGG
eukprot:CAMPEP_0198228602 /NCGR_PEP_ID=MMETSP1445-20131203/113676_1 /TAXON_ID=36898 /ORGANISM="Pyramimonas sp., Strain CCMP2087" /LENGTH=127 /DNA_ID=CAMNT_0043909007 /DNA_START=1020 /DNA_END=1407 /DNA_ORIENTATION=-